MTSVVESPWLAKNFTIQKSKDLTFLKINALNPVLASRLLSVALQSCPKLSQLEILKEFDQTLTKQIGEYFRF